MLMNPCSNSKCKIRYTCKHAILHEESSVCCISTKPRHDSYHNPDALTCPECEPSTLGDIIEEEDIII